MTDLLVIGGGAAGLMAAGAACARGLTVTVLEHNPRDRAKAAYHRKGRCKRHKRQRRAGVSALCAA